MSKGAYCRHCGRKAGRWKRGLCGRCYNDTAVRARYPSRNVWAAARPAPRPGPGDAAPLPGLPGSPERRDALADRAARGVSLFGKQGGP